MVMPLRDYFQSYFERQFIFYVSFIQRGWLKGIGVGGNVAQGSGKPGPGTAGGSGYVTIKFLPDSSYEGESHSLSFF